MKNEYNEQNTLELIEKYFVHNKPIVINSDGSVSCEGDVQLKIDANVTKLPVRFSHVGGSFRCMRSLLTSLEGSPAHVSGHFNCDYNYLTSLKGSPKLVDGYFSCSRNKITSLASDLTYVGDDFYCDFNQLTSLEGCIGKIGKGFYCDFNQLTSLEGGPTMACFNGLGEYSCGGNPLETLLGIPTNIPGTLFITYSPQLPLMRALVASEIKFDRNDVIPAYISTLLNKYAGQGKAGMMKCSSELLTLGKKLDVDLRQNARW